MRRIFRDPGMQARFDESGYVFQDFLGPEEIAQLRALYFATAGSGHETYEFAAPLRYYISIFDRDPQHRRAANSGIRAFFEDAVARLMVDYRILYCNFMVKQPGGGEIEAHQDFTWVDEEKHVGFNLWVPLEDTDEHNGCFHLVAGSHRLIDASFRAASIPDTLTRYNQALKPFMQSVPVAAGRGILFDHRLFHFSPDNRSDRPRVAAQLVLIPREAQAVIAHYDAADPEHVKLLAVPDDDYLTDNNLWEAPRDLPVVETKPFRRLPDEAEILARLRRHGAANRPLFRLFKDAEHQARFERDGFLHFPLLEPADVERLRAHYLEFSDGGRVENTGYGMFISLDGAELAQKRRTIELIRETVLPRLERYVHDCKAHLGSYLVKVPDEVSYTFPHQDWTFIDNEQMDRVFSLTVWIALGDYDRESGSIGFVKGSHRFFENVNCSPSPATRTPTQGLEGVLFGYLSFPEMRAGDALAFNNKTIHAALPNRSEQQRVAVGIGLTPLAAEIYHYFLKPGTSDTLLKLKVEEEFFLHYNNDLLQALWQAGRVPEHCRVVGELPHRLGRVTAQELEELCVRHGGTRNDVVYRPAHASAPAAPAEATPAAGR